MVVAVATLLDWTPESLNWKYWPVNRSQESQPTRETLKVQNSWKDITETISQYTFTHFLSIVSTNPVDPLANAYFYFADLEAEDESLDARVTALENSAGDNANGKLRYICF